jgi:3-methyladenine DNA glycosylase AlkD
VADARRALTSLSRPAGGTFDPSRYFRSTGRLGFYNVPAAAVRTIARDVVARHPQWSVDDAMAFADVLMADRHLEAKGVGIEALARFHAQFTPRLLAPWKRWLAGNRADNWATTDSLCGSLVGPLLVAYPSLLPRISAWASHRNLWVRRASLVSLIPSLRSGAALDEAYELALALHGDPEDLIQKAVGWVLREAGKVDPARLERYLRAHFDQIPRTTLRYAIERFPEKKRRQFLSS